MFILFCLFETFEALRSRKQFPVAADRTCQGTLFFFFFFTFEKSFQRKDFATIQLIWLGNWPRVFTIVVYTHLPQSPSIANKTNRSPYSDCNLCHGLASHFLFELSLGGLSAIDRLSFEKTAVLQYSLSLRIHLHFELYFKLFRYSWVTLAWKLESKFSKRVAQFRPAFVAFDFLPPSWRNVDVYGQQIRNLTSFARDNVLDKIRFRMNSVEF